MTVNSSIEVERHLLLASVGIVCTGHLSAIFQAPASNPLIAQLEERETVIVFSSSLPHPE
jgi:hypothetical protein